MGESRVRSERSFANSLNRRQLLRRGGIAGGAIALAGLAGHGSARATTEPDEATGTPEALTPIVSRSGADLSGQELNLYSSRHYDTDQEFYDDFTARSGVKINLIEADADQLIERIKSEGDAGPADVLLTVDAGRLWRAQDAGIFQPIKSDVLEQRVPSALRDPDGNWFGFSRRARVFAYAKDRVDPATLSTYEDLADPKWQGKILVRSSSNVYNQSLVGALIEALGLDGTQKWAEGLVANFARDPQGGDIDQITAVAAGEGDIAITNHYYYLRLLNSTDDAQRKAAEATALFFPNQGEGQRGTHVNISGGGVVRTAPHPDAAIAFLEYMVSDEAQELFGKGNYEYPVVEGIPLEASVQALGSFIADPIDVRVFGENNELALLLMLRAGWN